MLFELWGPDRAGTDYSAFRYVRFYRAAISQAGTGANPYPQIYCDTHADQHSLSNNHFSSQYRTGSYVRVFCDDAVMRDNGTGVDDSSETDLCIAAHVRQRHYLHPIIQPGAGFDDSAGVE